MNIGKQVRLNRLFAHPSGRLCSVAVDHFINYGMGIPPGLSDIARTLGEIVEGGPDAITMHRGVAASAWRQFAGKVPYILQSTLLRLDGTCDERVATPEDALLMGADGFAVCGLVRGAGEGRHLRNIADDVARAARCEMPVICHIYPLKVVRKKPEISFEPDDVAWAVRCAMEVGADVIKTPYCNDIKAFGQIARECPVPVVAAGGPKTKTREDFLKMLRDIVRSGARGATMGRNIWGSANIAETIRAAKLIIHA